MFEQILVRSDAVSSYYINTSVSTELFYVSTEHVFYASIELFYGSVLFAQVKQVSIW